MIYVKDVSEYVGKGYLLFKASQLFFYEHLDSCIMSIWTVYCRQILSRQSIPAKELLRINVLL
jgi:hypothetical protein